jgi:hypothetical protein
MPLGGRSVGNRGQGPQFAIQPPLQFQRQLTLAAALKVQLKVDQFSRIQPTIVVVVERVAVKVFILSIPQELPRARFASVS